MSSADRNSSIRLVTAIPSAGTGSSSIDRDPNTPSWSSSVTYTTSPLAWSTFANSAPATIAPKSSDSTRRVVPKRSRLSRLVSKASKDMLRDSKPSKENKENVKPVPKSSRDQSPGPNKLLNKASRDRLRQRSSMDLLTLKSYRRSTERLADDPAPSQQTYSTISTIPFNPQSVHATSIPLDSCADQSLVIVEDTRYHDDDVDEVIVIKKRKSRIGLDFGWALGSGGSEDNRRSLDAGRKVADVTAKSSDSNKGDKWWTIGRGRRDSKDKDRALGKNKARSKSKDTLRVISPEPECLEPRHPTLGRRPGTHSRTHSLDSGILLNLPALSAIRPSTKTTDPPSNPSHSPPNSPMPTLSRPSTPTPNLSIPSRSSTSGMEAVMSAPDTPPGILPRPVRIVPMDDPDAPPKSGSLALRAMRSVRSMARIASWAQPKGAHNDELEERDEKTKDTIRERKRDAKSSTGTIRYSGSSWEVGPQSLRGALSTDIMPDASPIPLDHRLDTPECDIPDGTSAGAVSSADYFSDKKKKRSKSKEGRSRSGTTTSASTIISTLSGLTGSRLSLRPSSRLSIKTSNRLSVDSSRPPSIISHVSSDDVHRSNCSGESKLGGGGQRTSASSVRWNDRIIIEQTVREQMRLDKHEQERMATVLKLGKGVKEFPVVEKKDPEGVDAKQLTPFAGIFDPPAVSLPVTITPAGNQSGLTLAADENDDFEHLSNTTIGVPISPQVTEIYRVSTTDSFSLVDVPAQDHSHLDSPLAFARPQDAKTVRPRPMSDQVPGRTRHVEGQGDATLCVLNAATSDLASLINRLDLCVTPDGTPLRPLTPPLGKMPRMSSSSPVVDWAPHDSPLRTRMTRSATVSHTNTTVTTVRANAQSRVKSPLNNVTVAVSPSLSSGSKDTAPPVKKSIIGAWPPPAAAAPMASSKVFIPVRTTVRPSDVVRQRRLESPPLAVDSSPPLIALRPASTAPTKAKLARSFVPDGIPSYSRHQRSSSRSSSSKSKIALTPVTEQNASLSSMLDGVRLSSGNTFVLRSPKSSIHQRMSNDGTPCPSPVPARRRSHSRQSLGSQTKNGARPMASEARLGLGGLGTMGSTGTQHSADPDELDSDIPDELQVILSSQSDSSGESDADDSSPFIGNMLSTASLSSPLPSPGLPPPLPLPSPVPSDRVDLPTLALRAPSPASDEDNEADVDETGSSEPESSESDSDDTKQSFDFTGELQKLASFTSAERGSFVQMLETAFMTPTRIGGITDLGAGLMLPPIPLPTTTRDSTMDEQENSALLHADISSFTESSRSDASNGKLNIAFKFGKPSSHRLIDAPLNLSDVIPPVLRNNRSRSSSLFSGSPLHRSSMYHGRSPSESFALHDSMLDSIYRQALQDVAAPSRFDAKPDKSFSPVFEESEKHSARYGDFKLRPAKLEMVSELKGYMEPSPGPVRSRHSRNTMNASSPYPISHSPLDFSKSDAEEVPSPRSSHGRRMSMASVTSISSYAATVQGDVADSFNYDISTGRVSNDISVDDTYSFLEQSRHQNRRSIDSDASSFYFRASGASQRRSQCHDDSRTSVSSIAAPPVGFGGHPYGRHSRARDSTDSINSLLQAHGVSTSARRSSWAARRKRDSVDSIMSNVSVARLGRPGLGDKMLESATGLSSIEASPIASEHRRSERSSGGRSSFDSILDDDRSIVSSLFDRVGQPESINSESVFGHDNLPRGNLFAPGKSHRPISILSDGSDQSISDDDTYITMFDGDQVRRKEIGSSFEQSPCVQIGKRKHSRVHVDIRDDDDTETLSDEVGTPSRVSFKFETRSGHIGYDSPQDSAVTGQTEDTVETDDPISVLPATAAHAAEDPFLSVTELGVAQLLDESDSGESQSSLHDGGLKIFIHEATPVAMDDTQHRARPRPQAYLRPVSQISRSSVITDIIEEEEVPGLCHSSGPDRTSMISFASQSSDSVYLDSDNDMMDWDNEHNEALLKYHALKREAQETVSLSKATWEDTPFSVYALSSFRPPTDPAQWQAMIEYSQAAFIPLPSELRLKRPRFSPYYSRTRKLSSSTLNSRPASLELHRQSPPAIAEPTSPLPKLNIFSSTSPLAADLDKEHLCREAGHHIFGNAKRKAPSSTKRKALDSNALIPSFIVQSRLSDSKHTIQRSEGKSFVNKENEAHGLLTSANTSLRIQRPRPKRRPASMIANVTTLRI